MTGQDRSPDLGKVTHLMVDMDGVLFRGDSPLAGASEFLNWLRLRLIRFNLLTNNSTKTPAENVEMLARMGIAVQPAEIFTSSMATAAYLKGLDAAGQQAYVIGESGLRTALVEAGIGITESSRDAQWVVCGLDRLVTYDKLQDAALAIERGAHFVATNADTSLPVEDGLIPGAGALQAALIATTGVRPVVIGKPETQMLELGMAALGGEHSNSAMLGDRLDTDIEAANRLPILAILVLTGVSQREDIGSSTGQPDVIVNDLAELITIWDSRR